MAAFRLLLILAALFGFFVLGILLQGLPAQYRAAATHRLSLVFCRSLLALSKVRLVVEGDWPRNRPVLIVPNHVSWIDIPAFGALAPFCFLAKSEIATWPLVSALAAAQGTVFVERRRRRSIPATNHALAARMLENRPVLLFPEGTTVAGPPPGRFLSSHLGAARDLLAAAAEQDAVTIQPVAIAYSRPDAAWIGDDALLPHLWRVLRRPPLTCNIRFCAPLVFVRGGDRKALARVAQDRVTAALRHEKVTPREAIRPIAALAHAARHRA